MDCTDCNRLFSLHTGCRDCRPFSRRKDYTDCSRLFSLLLVGVEQSICWKLNHPRLRRDYKDCTLWRRKGCTGCRPFSPRLGCTGYRPLSRRMGCTGYRPSWRRKGCTGYRPFSRRTGCRPFSRRKGCTACKLLAEWSAALAWPPAIALNVLILRSRRLPALPAIRHPRPRFRHRRRPE